MRRSLRTRLALLLSGFVLVLIVFPMIANNFFGTKYYLKNKTNILENTYLSIQTEYNITGNMNDLIYTIKHWEIDRGLRFTIANEDFRTVYSSGGSTQSNSALKNHALPYSPKSAIVEGIVKNYFDGYGDRPVLEIMQGEEDGSGYLTVYGKETLGDALYYITISCNLASIQEGIDLSNQFLLLSSLVAVFFGVFIILFTTHRFTQPILDINHATMALANLDFSKKIEVHRMDELGELANSINHMSEKLEFSINQLKEDVRQQEKIAEMRQEFISNVSHELKTPISIIMGYSEGLQLNINQADKESYCDIILDETKKMDRLVKQLLAISQLQSGGMEPALEEFDLTRLTKWILNKNALRFQEKEISYHLVAAENMYVTADPNFVDQVITNYLSNALNHTPPQGEIRVTMRREPVPAKISFLPEIDTGIGTGTDMGIGTGIDTETALAEQIRFTVYNSGSNIPEEKLPRLWESFYKVDKARTREYGGQGLGLYIVKTLQDLLHGTYGAANTADGVEFWFTLPAAPIPADDWEEDL